MQKVGGIEYFLKCNYQIKKTDFKLSDFWEEVFLSHEKINYGYAINNRLQVKAQKPNNNQHILIQGKSFFKPHFLTNDVDLVENWFHWNGQIKSLQEMQALCPQMNWLEYRQVRDAIP